MNIKKLVSICKQQGIRLTQQRGQNLLVDENMLSRISDITIADSGDSVIEIGSALGNWTDYLADRATQVYAIEVDRKLYSILTQRMATRENVEPIHADITRFDLEALISSKPDCHFSIAGNLPYQLTSPILFQIIELYRRLPEGRLNRTCIMVQKEVAERMVAESGTKDYGRLTVMLSYYARVNLEWDVPRRCFFPVPRVDSSFVSLDFGQGVCTDVKQDELFERIVKVAFSQRRKQAAKLLSGFGYQGVTLNRDDWRAIFAKAGLDDTLRAGAISPKDFNDLVGFASEMIESKL